MIGKLGACLAFALVGFSAGSSFAAVTLAPIFADHMVLQQGVPLLLWGTAAPSEQVTVTVGSDTGHATADTHGDWMVHLAPLPANAQPVDVKIVGSNSITLHDVLLGDVWICSGQSNMEFGIGMAHNAVEAIPKADHPQLRLCTVGKQIPFTPQKEEKGNWVTCTPDSVKSHGWSGFSAVAYFFGQEIQASRNIPVGLVQDCWSGTPAEAWTSLEALQSNPKLSHYAQQFVKDRDALPQLKQTYDTQLLPAWKQAYAAWDTQFGQAYAQALKDWEVKKEAALKAGQPEPPHPQMGGVRPKKPIFAGDNSGEPTVLFNGMINPIVPLAIKGVIWDQGEGNADSLARCMEYATLFPAMINDWRQRWGAINPPLARFPFIFVQLSGWSGAWNYPILRDAQFSALSLPNTGMAVTLDVGEENAIHSLDKADVGHRLALAARHVAYGENIVYSGPVFQSMQAEGNKFRIHFTQIGGGLVIGSAPPIRLGMQAAPPATALQGFAIGASSDKHLAPAQARIDGDTVLVWNDKITNPTVVRYAWVPWPKPAANLYNKEGLPAVPFASDSPVIRTDK